MHPGALLFFRDFLVSEYIWQLKHVLSIWTNNEACVILFFSKSFFRVLILLSCPFDAKLMHVGLNNEKI